MSDPLENMVEITLPSETEEGKRADFLKVMETLKLLNVQLVHS